LRVYIFYEKISDLYKTHMHINEFEMSCYHSIVVVKTISTDLY